MDCHNPYFNRWFSAIKNFAGLTKSEKKVTILILIDGFLQCRVQKRIRNQDGCHNPYFNRWFSAIV